MSKIIYCRFLVLIGLCFTLLGLVSWGWPVTETKTYHAPNWTPDRRIVAEVQVVKLQRTLISNSEYVGGYTGIHIPSIEKKYTKNEIKYTNIIESNNRLIKEIYKNLPDITGSQKEFLKNLEINILD